MSQPYPWKTEPLSHQKDWWEKTRALPGWGILWEQGTGKSKLTIDTASWLFLAGKIDALVIIAPNGVHRNWVVDEIPKHLPDSIQSSVLFWRTSKAANKEFQKDAQTTLRAPGLAVVAISYHGIMTEAGDIFIRKVLSNRRVLLVLDESARIKAPKVKWSIRSMSYGKLAPFRRILTGTPVANAPFDVFTQLSFVKPDIWNGIGCRSYTAFRNFFGVFEQRRDPRSGRMYQDLVRYRNLNILADIVKTVGCRVTKAEVLDLPPKLYTKRYFDLSPEQRRLYEEMKNSYELRLESGEVTAMLVIVQLLRFQQIISGFIADDERNIIKLKDNPRLTLFREIVGDVDGKFIVFAKFTHDIDVIMAALKEDGVEAVRYDGQTSPEDRGKAIEAFQRGTARAFVANPAAAAEGLTLHAATTVIYYNNSYKLTDRLQSEDRAHRIGQKSAVTYIDIVASDTVDEKIVGALRDKLDVASTITGDKLKEWI